MHIVKAVLALVSEFTIAIFCLFILRDIFANQFVGLSLELVANRYPPFVARNDDDNNILNVYSEEQILHLFMETTIAKYVSEQTAMPAEGPQTKRKVIIIIKLLVNKSLSCFRQAN